MAALRQEYSDTLVQEESPPFIVVDISLLSLNEKIRLQRLADRIDVYLTKQS
ncbi:MAG: hypothetical protein H6767_02380 [Candidatus Peribacteria bacterium]|nr:MAG: hypothetical protein H6767_02380 [Candidatus Peribacteria bacterium]